MGNKASAPGSSSSSSLFGGAVDTSSLYVYHIGSSRVMFSHDWVTGIGSAWFDTVDQSEFARDTSAPGKTVHTSGMELRGRSITIEVTDLSDTLMGVSKGNRFKVLCNWGHEQVPEASLRCSELNLVLQVSVPDFEVREDDDAPPGKARTQYAAYRVTTTLKRVDAADAGSAGAAAGGKAAATKTKILQQCEVHKRIGDFSALDADVRAFYRPQKQLLDAVPSLPWTLPKWAKTQDGKLLEERRTRLHSYIQRISATRKAVFLPSLARFLGLDLDLLQRQLGFDWAGDASVDEAKVRGGTDGQGAEADSDDDSDGDDV